MLFSFATHLSAQPSKSRFRYLSAKDGLTGGTISCITQSRSGFMWIGAHPGGVYKYDGYSFKKYVPLPHDSTGLLSDDIRALSEDSSGMIWIGTGSTGLYHLEPRTGKFSRFIHNAKDTNSLSSDWIDFLITDSKKRVWVMTSMGLDMYDAANNKFIHYTYDKNNQNYPSTYYPGDRVSLTEDPKKGVLLTAGVDLFYPDTASRTLKVLAIYDGQERLAVDDIFPQKGSSIGIFIYGKEKQYKMVCKFDVSTQRVIEQYCEFPAWAASGIIPINDSSYYVGSTDGLFVFDIKSRSISAVPLHTPEIPNNLTPRMFTMKADRNQNLWIGTRGGNIYILDKRKNLFTNHNLPVDTNEDGTLSRICRAMIRTRDGKFLAASTTGKVFQWDSVHRIFKSLFTITLDLGRSYVPFINRLYEDHDGNLWASVINEGPIIIRNKRTGVTKRMYFSKDSLTPPFFAMSGMAIYEDKSGLIWLGSGNSFGNRNDFASVDLKTGIIKPYRLPVPRDAETAYSVSVFFEDSNGMFWIGTETGLYLFDRSSGKFTRYFHRDKDPKSLSSDDVSNILEDKSGRFWVATRNGGLNLFDRNTKEFTHFTERDGLNSNWIKGVIEANDGALWLSTLAGISRFDPKEKTFTSYGWEDGIYLSNVQKSGTLLSNGEMFFAAEGGVISFYPEQVSSFRISAPLVITSFSVTGQNRYSELSNQDTINLQYDENDVSFGFAAIDFGNTISKHYKYKLDGLNEEWFDNGNRNYASFTNIPPGNYVFRVKAMTRQGEWDTNEIAISIYISPPYWSMWWFRISIALLVIGGIAYFYRRREQSRKQHLADLEAAREKERFDLASELHDGPLQDLYATRFIIDPVISQVDSNSYKLDELLQKVRSDLRTITSELQIPRFDFGFAEELRLYIDSFQEKHPSLRVIPNITKEDVPIDSKAMYNLYRIFRTAFINTSKHADATEVRIQFHSDSSGVSLIITDNGKGFTVPNDLSEFVKTKHYGMFMMKSFADAIGATFAISSEIGKGTTVSVSL